MEPLKVTFSFTTPIVQDSEYPIHLDALLAWCVVNEAEFFGSANAWAAGDDLSHVLGRASSANGEWVWQASRLSFTPASERFLMSVTRRCEPLLYMDGYDRGVIDARRPRNYINGGSGHERAYQFLMPYQWMECAEAYCIGEREDIESLLARLSAIGKLTRNGFGQIKNVTVESCPQDAERWRLRVLPQGIEGYEGVEYISSFQCIRAPYWNKTNRVMAYEPIVL